MSSYQKIQQAKAEAVLSTENRQIFQVLSSETRLEVLSCVRTHQPVTVGSIVERTGLPQSSVSNALGKLGRIGFVSMERDGRHNLYTVGAGIQQFKDRLQLRLDVSTEGGDLEDVGQEGF